MQLESVEQVFLPFPTERHLISPVTRIRSTLLMSSLKTLRDEGLFSDYESKLADQHRDTILGVTTPCWLPIDVGLAHYNACNDLGLSPTRVLDIAHRVSSRAEGTFLGVALGLARGVGVTPWTVLGQTRRVWERAFSGGGVSVHKLGESEARIEIVAWPCAQIDYCRLAFRGLVQGVSSLLTKSTHVRDLGALADSPNSVAYRVNWT